jgi:hypothetical protein
MTEYSGLWTCRIFDPTYVIGDQTPQKEHELVRAEAVINFQTTSSSLEGTIEWPDVSGVSGLDLKNGTVQPGAGDEPVPGTNTDG